MITKALELEERDWREIYYALDSKLKEVEDERFGDKNEEEIASWRAHLQAIIEKIEAIPGIIL